MKPSDKKTTNSKMSYIKYYIPYSIKKKLNTNITQYYIIRYEMDLTPSNFSFLLFSIYQVSRYRMQYLYDMQFTVYLFRPHFLLKYLFRPVVKSFIPPPTK